MKNQFWGSFRRQIYWYCFALFFFNTGTTTIYAMIEAALPQQGQPLQESQQADMIRVPISCDTFAFTSAYYEQLKAVCTRANTASGEMLFTEQSPARLYAIAYIITQLVNKRSLEEGPPFELRTPFHGTRLSSISFAEYLFKIVRHVYCSERCYLHTLVYMDRYFEKNPSCKLSIFTIHYLFAAALLIAIKFLEDTYYKNAYYAHIFDIPLTKLNKLERKFFREINFSLSVDEETMRYYATRIDHQASQLLQMDHIQINYTAPQSLPPTTTSPPQQIVEAHWCCKRFC
jgi:hypothetical protein